MQPPTDTKLKGWKSATALCGKTKISNVATDCHVGSPEEDHLGKTSPSKVCVEAVDMEEVIQAAVLQETITRMGTSPGIVPPMWWSHRRQLARRR